MTILSFFLLSFSDILLTLIRVPDYGMCDSLNLIF